MSYWTSVDIEKLELRIPKSDFPLKSDLIVGFESPRLVIQEDEDDGKEEGEYWLFEGDFSGRYNYASCIDELKELCIKYKGTLIATETGEDGGDDVEYTRVREGIVKKVKIIEE